MCNGDVIYTGLFQCHQLEIDLDHKVTRSQIQSHIWCVMAVTVSVTVFIVQAIMELAKASKKEGALWR